MIIAGKYVPPHMRNGAKLEPSVLPFQPVKKPTTAGQSRWSKQEKTNKNKPKKESKKSILREQGPHVKPHCELFLADLPASLRSLQTLSGFFHPYGEISNIQFFPAGTPFPYDVTRRNLIEPVDFAKSNCAVIEFLTARVAKFVVGVLRKRIEVLNFRIGLLKPGLAEEMENQLKRLVDSIYIPSYQINKSQTSFLNEAPAFTLYSSEELSEVESASTKRVTPFKQTHNDQAYFTGSSESYISNTSDSDLGRYDTSDDDTDLLTLALKNGIKVIRD